MVVEAPGFDFVTRLKELVELENQEWPGDDLFSLSPLTSPESSPGSTPSSSPRMQTVELPTEGPTLQMDPSNATPAKQRKRKMGARKKATRRTRRREAKMAEKDGPPTRDKAQEKYAEKSTLLFTTTPTAEAPVTSTAYVALNGCKEEAKIYSLHHLLSKKKFNLLDWDGW